MAKELIHKNPSLYPFIYFLSLMSWKFDPRCLVECVKGRPCDIEILHLKRRKRTWPLHCLKLDRVLPRDFKAILSSKTYRSSMSEDVVIFGPTYNTSMRGRYKWAKGSKNTIMLSHEEGINFCRRFSTFGYLHIIFIFFSVCSFFGIIV